MVVVNNGQSVIGQQVSIRVLSLLQTGAGIIIFADLNMPAASEKPAMIAAPAPAK
jgi:hypothetical protein